MSVETQNKVLKICRIRCQVDAVLYVFTLVGNEGLKPELLSYHYLLMHSASSNNVEGRHCLHGNAKSKGDVFFCGVQLSRSWDQEVC